jgi:hypothetical protein
MVYEKNGLRSLLFSFDFKDGKYILDRDLLL